MLSKKVKSIISAVAITIFVASNVPTSVYAEGINTKTVIEKVAEIYEIKNNLVYVNGDGEEITSGVWYNMGRNTIKENTTMEVVNDKVYLTITLAYDMLSNYTGYNLTVDGKEVQLQEGKNSYKFEVASKDKITSNVIFNLEGAMGKYNASYKITFDTTSLPETPKEEVPETPAEMPETPSTDTDTSDASAEVTESYVVGNEILNKSEISANMIRKFFEENSKVEVINNEKYVTFKFNQSDALENMKIFVNTKETNYEVMEDTGTIRSIRFKVSDLKDSLKVSMYVNLIKQVVDFDIKLLEKSDENKTDNNEENTGSGNENNNSNGTNNSNKEETTENVTVKGRLYSIKNQLIHHSESSKAMFRKMLDENSKVEIIGNKTYVTFTFLQDSITDKHTVYVNGSLASQQIVSKSETNDTVSVRFQVASLSDEIKISVYIPMMGKTVECEVVLIEDTLTFIKDFEVSTENKNLLPQTGSPIDLTMSLGAGSALLAVAGILKKRRK